jgi:small subunit ribosomal protein S13
MARIAGVDLPKAKRMEVALTYIFGIGRSTARKILGEAGVDLEREDRRPSRGRPRQAPPHHRRHQGRGRPAPRGRAQHQALRRPRRYRGLRHRKNLPVRGQRTHTNARTRKGPRKTIAGKKSAPSKG